ncbi:hypothetical protein [Nitrosomonas sp.]|uniref:hypothetical protein n=1 Tax=Nitrosomonas sp. TaxID=42353 RepID=UPI00272FBDB7|nr:hypothetical protein [Nitrosomonas sp.]MDP2224454.1 hypothetical protein [Nitrosomonas sp.]
MDINIEVIGKLLAPVFTAILGFIVKKYFEARPKLITYLVHASAIPFRSEENEMTVNTHSIVVRNSGERTAHNVRIGHNFLPAHQVFPQVSHAIIAGVNSSAEILVPTLVPGEQVTISYLYFPPCLWSEVHSYCKCDEMAAKYINIVPSPQLGKLEETIIWGLIFVGASTIVYWIIYWLWLWANNAA